MEYLKIEGTTVVQIVSTDHSTKLPEGEWLDCANLDGGVKVGDDTRMFDESWNLRPLSELVDEGYVQLAVAGPGESVPEGTVIEKVKDNKIVRKTTYDFALEGVRELGSLEYLDHEAEAIKSGTVDEMVALGHLSAAEATDIRASEARNQRDNLLSAVDTLVSNPLRWNELSESDQSDVAAYRQALLDVPQQAEFPDDIEWPDAPGALK